MSILKAAIPIDKFNPDKDKIALMLKSFTIKAKDEGISKKKRQYSEPYFVGLSLAETGFGTHQVNFVSDSYPNTKKDDPRKFLGNGMRVYGPENPGQFLVFDVLVMECDDDVRAVGENLRSIMNSKEMKATLLPMLAMNPTMAIAKEALTAVSGIVAKQLEKNKDDQLLRVHGTLMRDIMGTEDLPFNVGQLIADANDKVAVEFEVLGIKGSSRHRRQTEAAELK